jgi:glutathione S-transferase
MKLYYSRGSCSLAVTIALHELGIAFDAERVDSKTKVMASGGDFRQVNPNGYTPVLVLDSGELLTEVGVVLQYLADLQPAAGLAPAHGTLARYRLMEWLSFISTELHKSYSPLFATSTPEEYKVIVKERLAQRLGYLGGRLSGPYLLGEQFTVADAYLFVVLSWSKAVNVDLSAFSRLQQFQQRVAQRPAAQKALADHGLLK